MNTNDLIHTYETPEMEVFEITLSGVICASTSTTPMEDGGTITGNWN